MSDFKYLSTTAQASKKIKKNIFDLQGPIPVPVHTKKSVWIMRPISTDCFSQETLKTFFLMIGGHYLKHCANILLNDKKGGPTETFSVDK